MITYPVWTFLDFVNETGANPVKNWYKALSPAAQAQVDALLKNVCRVENPINWIGFKGFLRENTGERRSGNWPLLRTNGNIGF